MDLCQLKCQFEGSQVVHMTLRHSQENKHQAFATDLALPSRKEVRGEMKRAQLFLINVIGTLAHFFKLGLMSAELYQCFIQFVT